MSWPMPTSGPWNPGLGAMPNMTPEMQVGTGSCTPEQWAAMQQQNWHQWAQWQQQYAQWQSQYGEKYAQQMQLMQCAGNMPPLPPTNTAPPPAPPPPDKPPPPPPPHENNQPLYGKPSSQPTPVPAPNQKQTGNSGGYNNVNTQSGNIPNSSYAADMHPEKQMPGVNAEALKKLAEEERLFDIQFQKWEEEIQKWKRENVNHPDKKAYKEYEDKFEACRAQLLERRQQMNQKRARLMSNAPQTGNVNNALPSNMSTAIPPPLQTTSMGNQSGHNQNHKNVTTQNYYENQQYQQYNNMQQSSHYRNSNKNVDPQDRYESYEEVTDNYVSHKQDNSNFLTTGSSAKVIPGLDLVPDSEKGSATTNNKNYNNVIDITEESENYPQVQPKAPDYSTISKGINNILGDEKIMNILSMVRGQSTPAGNSNQDGIANNTYPGPDKNYPNVPPPNQWGNNENTYNAQQQGNRQHMFYNRQQVPNYPPHHAQQESMSRFPPPHNEKQFYDERQNNFPEEEYSDRNAQYDQQNPHQRGMAPKRPNIPPPRPLMSIVPPPQSMNQYPGGPTENRGVPNPQVNQPPRPKWIEEPLFTPSIIVEYEHKPLRLKARDFIEPVHVFDYDHKSKDGENKKKDFEKEVDDLFTRKPRRTDRDDGRQPSDRFNRDEGRPASDRFNRDQHYERRAPRDDIRDDHRSRFSSRDEYDERRRFDDRYDDRRRDERDKYSRRDDIYRDRERDAYRDRYRDYRRDDIRTRSRSRDRESRKRGHSKDSELSEASKKSRESINKPPDQPKHLVMIDDLLEAPGRDMRPDKIVVILRGPPGSGKSYLAKLIRDREAEYGGTARIMSIDDYFMQESEIEEKDPTTGKIVRKPQLKYEYDEKLEETYITSLKRAFKRSLTDGYFTFLIYDAVNDQLKSYADIWNYARQNGFQVYVCTMELDAQVCFKRNIHNRTLEDIEVISARFFPTPSHHIQLDATTLLQSAAITEVHMEDADDDVVVMEDAQETEVENSFSSKWERMDDAVQLARLDGINKPLRPSQLSMEDYLQLDDWKPNVAKPGKKTVRWADIEERREQEKMRAIGFVVGQTDWNRMTDPTMGSSALTQTKYIERVRRT